MVQIVPFGVFMKAIERIIQQAQQRPMRIALSETHDERVLAEWLMRRYGLYLAIVDSSHIDLGFRMFMADDAGHMAPSYRPDHAVDWQCLLRVHASRQGYAALDFFAPMTNGALRDGYLSPMSSSHWFFSSRLSPIWRNDGLSQCGDQMDCYREADEHRSGSCQAL